MPPEGPEVIACRVVEADHPELRAFLAREWAAADRRLFGPDLDWTSRPVAVEARAGRELAGVALGEVVAGMARLHDLLVAEARQGRGLGGRLVERFCARAAELGAARCFLRCPDTARHRRFYELDDLGWQRPVMARVCPSCQRRLPTSRGPLALERAARPCPDDSAPSPSTRLEIRP
mgnify:CR=1 FL=1